jgi:hypothetical protein
MLDHRLDGDAARGVCLRVEEDLGMPHAVRARPLEVGTRQVAEVALGLQHGHALVVDVEERLQVAERVGRAQLLDAREAQRDAVARGQLEHQLGLERALDVEV